MNKYTHYSMAAANKWRWHSFTPKEIASRGDGELVINADAMDKLQSLRDMLGKPLIITSAYRSPAWNKQVGGAKNSMHLQGRAFDVVMANHDPTSFINAAKKCGFTGFGFYPSSGFIHIDTGPARTWGKPFAQTRAGLSREPETVPESIKDDRAAKAALGAGASGGMAAALDHMPALGGMIGRLAPYAQLLALAIAAAFILWLILRRTRE